MLWSLTAIGQAAAEYVGLLITGAAQALGRTLASASRFMEDHPAVLIIAGVALFLMFLVTRRPRRR